MKSALVVVASLLVACGGSTEGAPPLPQPVEPTTAGGTHATEDPQFAQPHASSPGLGYAQDDGVSYPSPDWPVGKPEAHGLDPAKLDQAASVAAGKDSYCLLVIRHGTLVYERYFNGTDASTANLSWSIAKSYSATLVGIALDRGEIESLDQSAADFVSEWKGTDRESITIRNLISMTAGLKWDAFEDYVGLATLAKDGTQFAIDRTLTDKPGDKWVYDNGAVQVLERVFRSATGHTIDEYAKEHLWSKIGSRASWKHDPSGNATAYANVLASCRDHARLGYLYLHHGKWAGEQVVSKAFVDQALSPSQSMNKAYGFLWWLNAETPAKDAMGVAWSGRMVPFAPPDLFAARGFGNQFVDVIPSRDLVVVRFGKDPETGFDPVKLAADSRFGTHDEILKPVLDAITD